MGRQDRVRVRDMLRAQSGTIYESLAQSDQRELLASLERP